MLRFGLALLLIAVPVARVHAQSRVPVAVGSIAGGPAVRRVVTRTLSDDARVAVVDDAGAARIVFDGTLGGRGRRRTLTITAHDSSGLALGRERARGALPGTIASAIGRLLDAVLPLVTSTTAAPHEGSGSSPRETSRAAAPRGAAASSSDASSPFGEDVPLLVIAAGAGLRSRETAIDVLGGMTRSYHASPYTELYARIDTRPLGNDPTYARGLFAWAEIGYAVGLSSQLPDHTQVPTTYLRMGAHAGYLVPIDAWLEVGASFGVGWEHYDLGTNVVMPAVDYPYLRPAVRARLRIAGELFVIGAEVGYRALLSRGAFSDAFGAGGDSFGYDLGVSLSGATDFGLFYGVEAGWSQFVHAFSGTTAALAQGTHGTDGGYRLMATLGYALR